MEGLPIVLVQNLIVPRLCSAVDLISLSLTCKRLKCIVADDSVWKRFCVIQGRPHRRRRGSWRYTYWEQCSFLEWDSLESVLGRRQSKGLWGKLKTLFGGTRNKGEPSIDLCMAGVFQAGVSSLVNSLQGVVEQSMPTVGIFFESVREENNEFRITSWSEGGSDKIRGLYRPVIERSSGFIWVLDRSNLDELDGVQEEDVKWTSISNARSKKEFFNRVNPELPVAMPVLFIGNKADKPGLSPDEIIDYFDLPSKMGRTPWRLEMCSAISDRGPFFRGLKWLQHQITTNKNF